MLEIELIFQTSNSLSLYINITKICWIHSILIRFFKKNRDFLHFFMPIFFASHHPVLLSKVSIATAAAQGETYTKSPIFFIENITKKSRM